MSFIQTLKQMCAAIGSAPTGESLPRIRMDSALGVASTPVGRLAAPPSPAAAPAAPRPRQNHVGLYLGSHLPPSVMDYVLQTCTRLDHGLTVLTGLARIEAESLLLPYRASLDEAGIEPRYVLLSGNPAQQLAGAIRRRPELAFLVCNAEGYVGHRLIRGQLPADSLPVPVVLVAARGAEIEHLGSVLPGTPEHNNARG